MKLLKDMYYMDAKTNRIYFCKHFVPIHENLISVLYEVDDHLGGVLIEKKNLKCLPKEKYPELYV
jgi:hypothetical protein